MADAPQTLHIIKKSDPTGEKASTHRLRVLESMQDFVSDNLGLLLPLEKSWQPTDFLPDLRMPNWKDQVDRVREMSQNLSDELLVVLIGDMITEEALPSYQTELNRMEGVNDPTGTSDSPWAQWSRGWTSEENRHGDLLNKYLYLIGRVNMRAVEQTIQRLIGNGFSTDSQGNAFKVFIYTSFQERATKISHRNVGAIARAQGDAGLAKICNQIANDEARHEEAYKRFMDKIFEIDTANAMLCFRDMMKGMVAMPAENMDDGQDFNLYDKFAAVAQRIGVYTAKDYADIIDNLVARWKLTTIEGLSGEAAQAQDYLCGLADRYRKLADRFEKRAKNQPPMAFSWLDGRAI